MEGDRLGGECPNYACNPSKTLLRSARIYSYLKRAGEFGLSVGEVSFDWKKIATRRDHIIELITQNGKRYEEEFARAGIALVRGPARFVSEHTVEVDGRGLTAGRFVVATGSRPQIPDVEGLDRVGYLTSREAVLASGLPSSVAILGGGAVGVEFAQLYAAFDVPTTLIDNTDLVTTEDPEIRAYLRGLLEAQGLTVYEWAEVTGAGREGNRRWLTLTVEGRQERVVADEILVATGRAPAVDDLELQIPGVEMSDQGIVTDDTLQTRHPDFWAAGDVVGKMLFTHVASYEGYVAGTNAAGETPPLHEDLRVVPRVTFAEPEIASVGLTEPEARQSGYEVAVRRHDFSTQSRALMMGELNGFVKIVLSAASEEILGGHIIGPRAGELIHEIAVAMRNGLRFSQISETIHAYPTLAEAVGAAEAVKTPPSKKPPRELKG